MAYALQLRRRPTSTRARPTALDLDLGLQRHDHDIILTLRGAAGSERLTVLDKFIYVYVFFVSVVHVLIAVQ